jgi:lipopolysaccharide transport system permease protein
MSALSEVQTPPDLQDLADARRVVTLRPTRGWVSLRLDEVWRYRELLWFLALRDIKVRYKQTALGASWAVLQPLLTAVIFTVVFGRLARIPSDGVPYPIFALAGLVPWVFFAGAVGTTALSLLNNTSLISKVYFPRLCVPIASVLAGLVDMLVSSAVLVGAMFLYGVGLGPRALLVVPFMVLAAASALAIGLWLSAVAARYRDVRHVVPFMVQLWLFATPVAYPASLLPEPWRLASAVNPMVGVEEGFRWALIGSDSDVLPLALTSTLSAMVLLIGGLFFFRRQERSFADVL